MTLKIIVLAFLFLPGAMAARLPAAEKALERFVRTGFIVGACSVLPLFLVQLAVVLLRSVFSVSFIWLQESTLYLFGTLFLLSSGALLVMDQHVRVDIFYAKLAPKRRQLIDFLGAVLFVIPLSMLILIVSWDYVATSWSQLERSQEASGIHAVFLLKSLIPAFAVMLLFAGELMALRVFRQLRSSDD